MIIKKILYIISVIVGLFLIGLRFYIMHFVTDFFDLMVIVCSQAFISCMLIILKEVVWNETKK